MFFVVDVKGIMGPVANEGACGNSYTYYKLIAINLLSIMPLAYVDVPATVRGFAVEDLKS